MAAHIAHNYVNVVITAIMLCLNVAFLLYTYKLEHSGCKCALDWHRTFMECALALFVVLGVASMFGWKEPAWMSLLVFLVTVAYITVTRMFIKRIQHQACACAKSDTFDVLNVVNYVQIAMAALITLYVIVIGITLVSGESHTGASSRRRR